MADQTDRQDTSSAETPWCPEPQLEVSQDLELLAQEIAEAAVEEEEEEEEEEEVEEAKEGIGRETSPVPPVVLCVPTEEETYREDAKDDTATLVQERSEEEEDAREGDKQRSASPVDETSWVLVDAEEEDCRTTKGPDDNPDLKYNLLRKFLVAGDLRQKLTDAGLVCDEEDNGGDADEELKDMVMSCSESMVICDLPQMDGDEDSPSLQLKNFPDCSKKSGWRGTFAGARVEVEVERKGGLQVAAVRVWHVDLLSALSSLQSLANTAGLVSYADVDVTSLLARAA
ncbi:uncharacterized protein LOC122251918 [Penaeus japonicus]|uniref:uncharacterized protein LOC122251918 n=1 Tax=Penaeus japonicus TaxID=27405 RepID=UPI001C70F003|nr:uncharacterized protein LOC122251918 [Penaeus japonicus]